MICVDKSAGQENNVYTPVYQFDGSKGMLTATVEKQDSSHYMILETVSEEPIDAKITGKQLVEVNKSLEIFSKPYKTIIGILHFKEQPW